MRIPLFLPALLGLGLAAQTPPPAPGPAFTWRGALWASGAASTQSTSDGSLFLRSADSGDGHLAVDGLQLGADVTLADGWSLKFTLLAGQTARFLNEPARSSLFRVDRPASGPDGPFEIQWEEAHDRRGSSP